ncbi:MAG: GGDEF domain-containing protein, partial [Actinomycetota bacterium]
LTGLANRNLMNLELAGNMARSSRTKKPFALIMLDLDHFKQYNDTYGHAAGDRLLVEVAGIAIKHSRETDLVVRFGGEEFLIVLPETGSSTATAIAERLRKEVMETGFYPEEGKPAAHITVSLGIAAWRQDITGVDELIKLSDEALYRAKERGRNRVES